jgi:hypothetical protein
MRFREKDRRDEVTETFADARSRFDNQWLVSVSAFAAATAISCC